MAVNCFSGLFGRRKSTQKDVDLGSQVRHTSQCRDLGASCDFSYTVIPRVKEFQEPLPPYTASANAKSGVPANIVETVDSEINSLSDSLRELSLKIHDHPELKFEERYAHDVLTDFMESHGFKVQRHYLGLQTAWRAEFGYGKGGRVLGINSEMDALKGIGHACGHNLIAVSGCGVALAVKSALQTHKISGKVVLLGTPAEEGGGGKAILLDRGGYRDMDLCVMCHPGTGPSGSAGSGTSLALQNLSVEYFGQSAHAGAAPWDGTNALDAAFLAYSSISVLRQQIKPDHRVHGIVSGKDWSPNVIPDYAGMQWIMRAPSVAEVDVLVERVTNCLHAAALATGCKFSIEPGAAYYDLHPNPVLADEFCDVAERHYNLDTTKDSSTTASTDYGNVCYELPSLHPMYAIPTKPGGGNHTAAYAKAAATREAHEATMIITKCLALTGLRALRDDEFFKQVKDSFDKWKAQSRVGRSRQDPMLANFENRHPDVTQWQRGQKYV